MNENPELREPEQKIVTGGELKKITPDTIEDPLFIHGSAVICPYCFVAFPLAVLMERHRPHCPKRPK